MSLSLETITSVTKPSEMPGYSPYGYVIQPDGTTYMLLFQYFHGVVLALLYPELLVKFNEDPARKEENQWFEPVVIPDDPHEVRVLRTQEFELEMKEHMPAIRVCGMRMLSESGVSVDLPKSGVTPDQVTALRNVLDAMGIDRKGTVQLQRYEVQVPKLWDAIEAFNDSGSTYDFRADMTVDESDVEEW